MCDLEEETGGVPHLRVGGRRERGWGHPVRALKLAWIDLPYQQHPASSPPDDWLTFVLNQIRNLSRMPTFVTDGVSYQAAVAIVSASTALLVWILSS